MTTEAFLAAPRLALDTEFVWTKTYWARLGLVQAAGSDGFDRTRLHATPPAAIPLPRDAPPDLARAVLLDPMAASSVPLGSVLRDPSTAKILHDAHQDLVHLARWTGEKPVSVFDTKIAAGFCGFSSGLSLAKLVRELCGVELPKTETRSDWCRRPLAGEQLVYAAQDVAYLDEAACELARRARHSGPFASRARESEATSEATDRGTAAGAGTGARLGRRRPSKKGGPAPNRSKRDAGPLLARNRARRARRRR